MNTNEYTTPELKYVGEAEEVVLGMSFTGSDFLDEYAIPGSEFVADTE